jgi:hypothetical protein
MYGDFVTKPLGSDRFLVSFTRDTRADFGDAGDLPLFGQPLAPGATREWTARRLAGQKLEVCEGASGCATLERQFDSYEYDLH